MTKTAVCDKNWGTVDSRNPLGWREIAMSRDAFTALPLRPCNTAALADSGVPILVEQGRCDGFSWMRTTSAGALFYSALVEHGNKGGFGSLSTCRWLLFGAGAVPDGQAAGRAERGHDWMHALFGQRAEPA